MSTISPVHTEGEGGGEGEPLHPGTNRWDIHRRLCGPCGFPPLSAEWTSESIEVVGRLQGGRDNVKVVDAVLDQQEQEVDSDSTYTTYSLTFF